MENIEYIKVKILLLYQIERLRRMIKKKYTTIYDFLDDISFTNWVHQNNGTDIGYWDFWIEKRHMDCPQTKIGRVFGFATSKNWIGFWIY